MGHHITPVPNKLFKYNVSLHNLCTSRLELAHPLFGQFYYTFSTQQPIGSDLRASARQWYSSHHLRTHLV